MEEKSEKQVWRWLRQRGDGGGRRRVHVGCRRIRHRPAPLLAAGIGTQWRGPLLLVGEPRPSSLFVNTVAPSSS